jgi:hypothetical protein
MSRSMHLLARAMLIAIATSMLLVSPDLAQSPASSSAPTPSPQPSSLFPRMQFAGGDASQLVFTSTCGVWGHDPIALHGVGGAGTADLVVTFATYDEEAAQWAGTVVGSFTGTNGVTVPVEEQPALIYYDFDLGRWMLVASWAAQIPASACAPGSPAPS